MIKVFVQNASAEDELVLIGQIFKLVSGKWVRFESTRANKKFDLCLA